MPDETPPADDEGVTPDPDAGAKKALDAERKARRDAEKAKSDLEKRLKEYEDRDKSDSEKAADAVKAADARAEQAEQRALRLEVAADKGLTPAQAKRLVGTTREELEGDADEILAAFPVNNGGPPPSPKPVADLKSGSEPTTETVETDPAKLADTVPRL